MKLLFLEYLNISMNAIERIEGLESCESLRHRLINNTNRTLEVVFSRFRGFPYTQQVSLLSLCLRVIVNEKPLNLSVFLLIYGLRKLDLTLNFIGEITSAGRRFFS